MTERLADLIKVASNKAEELFRKSGEILPMYEATRPDGKRLIIPTPGIDKDTDVMLIKAIFAIENIDHYVYFTEAWIIDNTRSGQPLDLDKIKREGVRNHPDRREVVMFIAENRDGEILTASRYILRPEHGKAKLTPLKIDDLTNFESSGRMFGLLK
jgi:hypothetical protein